MSCVPRIIAKIHQAFFLHFCIQQVIKNWSRGRPGNEASTASTECLWYTCPQTSEAWGKVHCWKGSGKQQPKGKCIARCGNKCLHSGHNHQRQGTNGDATATCRYMQAAIYGSEPLHMAVLIGVQILVFQCTCPQAAAFLIPFSQCSSQIAFVFVGENTLQPDLPAYLWQPIIWTTFYATWPHERLWYVQSPS